MKNYELIAELVKYPAGHEVIIEKIVMNNNCSKVDEESTQVIAEIECVDFEESRIILC